MVDGLDGDRSFIHKIEKVLRCDACKACVDIFQLNSEWHFLIEMFRLWQKKSTYTVYIYMQHNKLLDAL